MAEAIYVPGGTKLKATTNVLGTTCEEPNTTFQEIISVAQYHSSISGPALPAIEINHGRWGILTVPLFSWDEAQLITVKTPVGGSGEAQIGTIGGTIAYQSINLTPQATGKTIYTFAKARLLDTYEVQSYKNEPQILVVRFLCLPDLSALGTATTTYYVKSTS